MSDFLPVPPNTTDADRDVLRKGASERVYVRVTRADQVTPEMIEWAVEELDIIYPDRIDWEDAWDRLEGTYFEDGSILEWGDNDTPAMRKIQREVRKARR